MSQKMLRCARCGGHFPAPGVEREGKVYCCDKCARGPLGMKAGMVAMPLLILGAGGLAGFWVARRTS